MTTMSTATRPACLLCGKPLQVVGTARKNGVRWHGDWHGRKYHKQCWFKLNPPLPQPTDILWTTRRPTRQVEACDQIHVTLFAPAV